MIEFFNGWTYAILWGVFLGCWLIRELIKWLWETQRWHIVIWFSAAILILSIALPLASNASGGAFNPGLSIILETVLFGFTLWFKFGGVDEDKDPGVSRKRFFHRRVDSLDGISSNMADRAARREKARGRKRGVYRKPFFWSAFERIFGRKDDDPFRW